MERLTRVFAETTHGTKGYEPVNEIMVNTESICNFSEIITTLGLLEDVLEKNYIESVEELDLILQGLKNVHQENANLKNELVKLKQKAILPKFQIGQTLFRIDFGSIVPFIVNEFYVHMKVDKTISILYFDYVGLVTEENELFATREEVEKFLRKALGDR